MYKPLADSTLMSMTKKEIIEFLRVAEHNAEVSQETLEQQVENLKDWKPVVHGRWLITEGSIEDAVCSNCGSVFQSYYETYPFCPNCGATMK